VSGQEHRSHTIVGSGLPKTGDFLPVNRGREARNVHFSHIHVPPSLHHCSHDRVVDTSSQSWSRLAQAFVELLDLCISTVWQATANGNLDEEKGGGGGLSYNVVLTLEHLYISLRRHESHRLALSGDAERERAWLCGILGREERGGAARPHGGGPAERVQGFRC
jgi:hypothetical protein